MESLNKLVIIKEEFSDDEIICYDSIEEIYKKYKDYDDTDFISITNYEIKAKMEECWENLISIQKKYEKMKLFLLKISIEEDEDISLLNPKSIKGRCIISNKIESEKEFLEEIGINEPKNLNVDETNDLFDYMIDRINLQQNNKSELIGRLSNGLSNQKKSIEILDDLIFEMTYEKLLNE